MLNKIYPLNLKFLLLFIAYIKITLNIKQSLILPYKIFYPPIDDLAKKEEVFQSLERGYFYTIFEIGNPKKKIPIYYTFNNSNLSFYSDSDDLSLLESSYIPSKSESYKILGKNQVQEDLLFNIDNDIYIKNFTFLNSDYNKKDVNYYAYIGLQNFYKENSRKKVKNPNFLYQLKILGLIDYISFSINQTSEDEGFLNINLEPNDYAPKLYSKEKKYTASVRTLESQLINSMSGELLWSIEISLVYYKINKKTIKMDIEHYELNDDQYAVLLNPLYGFIKCPFAYKNLIKKDFFDQFIKKSICSMSQANRLHFYWCKANKRDALKAKFPSLFFYYPVKNRNFTYIFELNFDDVFYEKNGILYFLIVYDSTIFGEDKFSQISEWVLGKPFLDKYQFSFDIEKKRVSFYENKIGYKNRKFLKNYSTKNANLTNAKFFKNKNLYLNQILPTKNLIIISISLFFIFVSFFCISYKLRVNHKKNIEEKYKADIELKETLENKD